MTAWLPRLCCLICCICSTAGYCSSIVYDHQAPSETWNGYSSASSAPMPTHPAVSSDNTLNSYTDGVLSLRTITTWCWDNGAVILLTNKQFHAHIGRKASLDFSINTTGNIGSNVLMTFNYSF